MSLIAVAAVVLLAWVLLGTLLGFALGHLIGRNKTGG